MPDTTISNLATDPSPTTADYLVTVDVDDTTAAASGTNKKVAVGTLPFAAATNPTVTGKLTAPVRVATPRADADAATITLDFGLSDFHTVTLGGNRTIAFSGATPGQVVRVEVVQDGTGGRTATWPTVRWPGGTAPTLATAANKADMLTIVVRADGTYAGALSLASY